MKIKVELHNAVVRKIRDKYILVDIKNNKVFITNEITNYLIQEMISTNHIDVSIYSKLYNLKFDDSIKDINNLIKFLDSNGLVKGSEILL
ncbi:hypothetical protein [Paraclostridium sordellii]|uniref:hypothetical protein n=1 Tax=Paraclostridium sordellii TaxID=1505 RepID=UPI0005E43E21|nr:hypothetical protein [Paeniclostridium sordellii]CEN26159.1 Uncharacterised protein [[Clostridium] sordellii] [Paeniclostridium sordellii]